MAEDTSTDVNTNSLDVEDTPDPASLQEQNSVPDFGGEWNPELPDQLVNALTATVREVNRQEMFDRRREVLRDRRNRFYERGYQHIYENTRNGSYTLGTPGSWVSGADGEQFQCGNYIDDYNIFEPFARVVYSIQTQNPPGVNFQAENPALPEDVEAAKNGEIFRIHYAHTNDEKQIQQDIIRMMALSGRVVTWTRTVEDVERLGYQPDGTPKRREKTDVYGTLETKVPILAKDQSQALYCIICDDPDVKICKSLYPEFAKKIKPGMAALGETTYERIARLGVLQGNRAYAQIGDPLTHLATRSYCFLRAANFVGEMYEDPFNEADETDVNEDGSAFTVKDKLNQLFPMGTCARYVGDVYTGARNCSMDDEVAIGFPLPGEGMHRMAIMDSMVVIQDRFNDNMNAAAEVWDHGWPSTWVDADDVEYDTIMDQKADPYAIRQKKVRGQGSKLADSFFREPNPELPVTFMQFVDNLSGPLAQFIMAAPPALFGAAMEDQKTASGYEQARNQAMGTQGVTWSSIQKLMAKMYYQAAILASRNPQYDDTIVVSLPSQVGTSQMQLAKLTKGNFGAFPDTDSSFPETTLQKRQTVTGLVTMAAQNPSGAQIFDSPDNWVLIKKYMGIPELVLPEADARDKQALELEELMGSAPIPPDPQALQQIQQQHAAATIQATMAGQPPPPPLDPLAGFQSSVTPAPEDYHSWEAEKCREWLSSEACRRELAQGNQQGVNNVRCHFREHMAQLPAENAMNMALNPPPMPKPLPGPPAGGPPPNPGANPSPVTM